MLPSKLPLMLWEMILPNEGLVDGWFTERLGGFFFFFKEIWSFSTVCEKQKESPKTKYWTKRASQKRPHRDSVGKKGPAFCVKSDVSVVFLKSLCWIMLLKGFVKRSKQEHHRSDKSVVVWPVGLVDYQEHPRHPAATSDGWILQIPKLAAQMEEEDPFCSCTTLQGAGGRALTAMSRSGWSSCYKNFSTICLQRDSWAFSSQERCIAAWRGGA